MGTQPLEAFWWGGKSLPIRSRGPHLIALLQSAWKEKREITEERSKLLGKKERFTPFCWKKEIVSPRYL